MVSAASAVVTVVGFIVLHFIYNNLTSGPKRVPAGKSLPDGPPAWPIVGNLPDMPASHFWLKFKEWSDKYGPIFSLNLAGSTHIVVSSEKLASTLLRERGSIYSDREQLPAAAQLLGDNLRPLLYPHGEKFRQGRKLMHLICKPSAVETYAGAQSLEATRAVFDTIRVPDEYDGWSDRFSSSVIFRIGFGKVMKDNDDPLLKRVFAVVRNLERVASPGTYMVDFFPILMYLPDWMAPFKRELKGLHAKELTLFRELLNDTRQEIANGTAPDCWEKMYLENKQDYDLTEDEGAYVVGTCFEAGSTTTAATIRAWIHVMIEFPEELRLVQEELDKVVGSERMPEFSDMRNLPRLRAVIKETLRWRPVVPGGIPHYTSKDDTINGYFIPAGTNVHPNQWAIHRDEEMYPNGETFTTDRWLKPGWPTYKEPLTEFPNLTGFSAFGYGRRICPGIHIAERSLNIVIARLAWACSFKKKIGKDGKEIPVPIYDYTHGLASWPKYFSVDIKARSPERFEVVKKAHDWEMQNDPLKDRWGKR